VTPACVLLHNGTSTGAVKQVQIATTGHSAARNTAHLVWQMLSHLCLVVVNLARSPIPAVMHTVADFIQSQLVMLTYSLRLHASVFPCICNLKQVTEEDVLGLQSDAFNPVEDPDSFDDMYACDRSVFSTSCMRSHLSPPCFG